MGTDAKGVRFCDECGRGMDKAVRIHLGAEYGPCCYSRVFVKASCPSCQGAMRRHRHAPASTPCDACTRATRVCVRCHRLTPRAAKMVSGQAVCASCSFHFAELMACDACERPSRRLFTTLFPSDAEEPPREARVCQPCKVKPTHATCAGCRRHRRVAGALTDGKSLCESCAKPEPDSHVCPGCGGQAPGGGAARCFACVRRDAATRQARLLGAGLEDVWCRDLWAAFTGELIADDKRLSNVRSIVDASIDYFRLLESKFDSREAITSRALHEAIDSPVHRTYLLAYRFLLNVLGLDAAEEDRVQSNEERRLAQILSRANALPSAGLLAGYVEQLRCSGLPLRTVRLYASVAQKFCERTGAALDRCWPAGAIQTYLVHTPGAANSLYKFVGHCRRTHGWDVSMPPKATLKHGPAAAAKAVDRMRLALGRVAGRPVGDLKLMEVSRVIAAATGLKLQQLVAGKHAPMAVEDLKAIKLADDAVIEPGHPLHPFARRWVDLIALRAAASSRRAATDS